MKSEQSIQNQLPGCIHDEIRAYSLTLLGRGTWSGNPKMLENRCLPANKNKRKYFNNLFTDFKVKRKIILICLSRVKPVTKTYSHFEWISKHSHTHSQIIRMSGTVTTTYTLYVYLICTDIAVMHFAQCTHKLHLNRLCCCSQRVAKPHKGAKQCE